MFVCLVTRRRCHPYDTSMHQPLSFCWCPTLFFCLFPHPALSSQPEKICSISFRVLCKLVMTMSTSAGAAPYLIYIRDYNPYTDKTAAFALLKEALGSGPARDYVHCNPPLSGYTAIGVNNNAIVGVLIYKRDSASKSRKWPLTVEAPCLGVNKSIRNAQIGSRLMDHFHQQHSAYRIRLTPMPPKNATIDRVSSVGQKPPLIRFYERLGYQDDSEDSDPGASRNVYRRMRKNPTRTS